MSRIRRRSANSLVVNHEKPNAVSALVGGSGVTTSAAPAQARSKSSRARKNGSPSRNTGSETATSSGPLRRTPTKMTAFMLSSSSRIGWLNGVLRKHSQSSRTRSARNPNLRPARRGAPPAGYRPRSGCGGGRRRFRHRPRSARRGERNKRARSRWRRHPQEHFYGLSRCSSNSTILYKRTRRDAPNRRSRPTITSGSIETTSVR